MFRHPNMAPGRGMNAVRLVETIHSRHPIQEERKKPDSCLSDDVRIDLPKPGGILRTEIGQGLHANEEDAVGGEVLPDPRNDGQEIRSQAVDLLSPEPVIGTRFEHHVLDARLVEHPVDPAQRPCGGLAAHARVDHAVGETRLAQPGLKKVGERLAGIHSESRRQARPEEEDGGSRFADVGARCGGGGGSLRGTIVPQGG